MPAFLSEFLSQMKAIWARLDAGQRLTIGVVMLATVAGLGGIVWFAGQPEYRPVFSALEQKELVQATRALEQASVPYRVDGVRVLVESGDFSAAKSVLMTSGAALGIGADPSQLSQMTSDKATRTHALNRMLEREAERKLMALQSVVHAHVSHSKPKRSPYTALDEETRSRAHVGLRITPGTSFTAVANAAIYEAAAALGVPPEHVTVTNLATMQTHSKDSDGRSSLDTSEFLSQQRHRSEELTARAQSLLDRVYPEHAVVRVSVVLDPAWTMTRERSAPDKQLIKRTTSTKENTSDPQDASIGGDSGTAGGPATIGTQRRAVTHKKEQKETEYAADGYKETNTGRLAPDIKKMTVALIIDEKVIEQPSDEQQLRDLVKNAIGWSDEWASDSDFTILKTALPELPEGPPSALPGVMSMVDRFGPMVGQVLAVVLVLLFLRGLLKRNTVPVARVAAPATAAPEPEAVVSPDAKARQVRREIEQAIADDPASISRLLETWLTEPRT